MEWIENIEIFLKIKETIRNKKGNKKKQII